MKKILIASLAILLISSAIEAYALSAAVQAVVSSGGSTTVNYCSDASIAGCWRMNAAGDATETDRSSAGNDLTESTGKTVDRSSTVPSGYSGYSKAFVIADEAMLQEAADGSELDINGADAKVSICAWVNPTSASGTTIYNIAGKYSATAGRQYKIQAVATGTNTVKFGFLTSTASDSDTVLNLYSATTNYAVDGSTWYHVCGVSDDVHNSIYINGAWSAEVDHTGGIYNGTAVFQIGTTASSSSSSFGGLIDEVIVLSRDLTATEVANIYNNGITGTKGMGD
jgi:hypothetical protein